MKPGIWLSFLVFIGIAALVTNNWSYWFPKDKEKDDEPD